MIPQKQRADEIQRREQVQSPDEQRPIAPSASSWQGLKHLAHILGIVVPLGGSFVAGMVVTQTSASMLLVLGLLGIVGTILLQSMWAVVLVPAALYVGLLLEAILPALLRGSGIASQLLLHPYLADMALFLGAFALLGISLSTFTDIQPTDSMLTKFHSGLAMQHLLSTILAILG